MKKVRREICPTCRGVLISKQESVSFSLNEKDVVVPNLPHWECQSCKEKVFDHESQVLIEKVVYKKKKASAA